MNGIEEIIRNVRGRLRSRLAFLGAAIRGHVVRTRETVRAWLDGGRGCYQCRSIDSIVVKLLNRPADF